MVCRALSAARQANVGGPGGRTAAEVAGPEHGGRRNAGAVVGDLDAAGVDLDGYDGGDAGVLAGVEPVVDKLLEDHQRPLSADMADLRG
jgi:hypothetical protein